MDAEQIHSLDSQNMWQKLVDFPAQWGEAMDLSSNLDLSIEEEHISNICFVGMGGSAAGGALMQAYLYDSCPYPIHVIQHYQIPGWINERTLLIASSFSGDTEETLAALTAGREQGAQAIAVTSGGELMLKAAKEGFDSIKLPGGMPTRTALGYTFVPLYRIFQYLGLIENDGDKILNETKQLLSEQNELFSDPDDNEALNLAEELDDTLPVIYSDTIMQPINLRWQSQFEENAKTLAYGGTLPEMTHNEIVGWDQLAHLTGRLSVIMLTGIDESPRVRRRLEIVKELVEDQTATLQILNSRGKNRLSRMFSLIQLADWTSFYLAILNDVDPTPVTKIDLLKSKLAEA